MKVTLTVCDTCGFSGEEKVRGGRTGGEALGDHVIAAAKDTGVAVRRHSCLMGCEHPCNVALSAPGKMTYVLGRFAPGPEAAEALVDYARKYGESDSGVVPYRNWPQGVKGHFISRVPALD